MYTIKNLAEDSGYTVATVSRALNNSPLVADKTKKKIFKIARENGYVPNALARGLVKRSSSSICVIVPDIVNPYFPLIVKAIQDRVNEEGMHVICGNSEWNPKTEKSLLQLSKEQRVAGIIMDPVGDRTIESIETIGLDIPIVFVGNKPEDGDMSSVLVDNYRATIKSVDYLVDKGHRDIVMLGGKEDTFVNRERFRGYVDGMKKHGLETRIRKIACEYGEINGQIATRELLASKSIPTAILAINDTVALGVIKEIKDHGMEVPQDISVIGFDDVEISEYIGLTTMREPRYEMGNKAATILMEEINACREGSTIPKQAIQYDSPIIERKTCKGIL